MNDTANLPFEYVLITDGMVTAKSTFTQAEADNMNEGMEKGTMWAKIPGSCETNFFERLTSVLNDGKAKSAAFSVTVSEDGIAVSFVPAFSDDKDKVFHPMTFTGSAKEVDSAFFQGLLSVTPEYSGYSDSLERHRESLRKEKEKMDSKGKKTASPEDKLKQRKEGEENETDIKTLANTPCSDINFKSVLERASLASMVKVYQGKISSETARKKIAAEITKVSGKSLADLGLETKQETLF